jgi:hypothetical protein
VCPQLGHHMFLQEAFLDDFGLYCYIGSLAWSIVVCFGPNMAQDLKLD